MRTEMRLTNDGSHTLYVPDIDECYHSTYGAVQESAHIFIKDGFLKYGKGSKPDGGCIKVLEIGFGTGLNAYLTLLEAERLKRQVCYTALELYPLAADAALKLNYPEILSAERSLFEKIHLLSWDERQVVSPYFTLCKMKVDFTGCELDDWYDVIYFDAFSPEKQPEMWSENRFRMIYNHSGKNAVLVTYCAKGSVRRAMQAAGFVVERLPGPEGKREIIFATNCTQLTIDN